MADKIQLIQDLDNEAEFQVYARVLQVEHKTDSAGDPYHSLKVKDDTGTTWMKAFKSHNLRVREGDLVRGKTKINVWKGKKSLNAWGDDLTVVEGSEAPPSPNSTHTPAQAGSPPQGPEKPVHGQSPALPLAEYQQWWIKRWEWYEHSPPIQRAIQRGEAVAGVIREAVGAEWMSQSPYDRNIERSPYPEDARGTGGQGQAPPESARSSYGFPGRPDSEPPYGVHPGDEDDDIPF